jgi:uncharacterized protein (DUF433 family)
MFMGRRGHMTLEQVLTIANQLSPIDKFRLVQQMLSEIISTDLHLEPVDMSLNQYFDFLAPDDIRIKGHRIGIETVLYEYLHRERSAEEIQSLYPTLSLADVYVTILYYLQNSQQVNQYLEDWLEWSHQQRKQQAEHPHPSAVRLRALKEQQALVDNMVCA